MEVSQYFDKTRLTHAEVIAKHNFPHIMIASELFESDFSTFMCVFPFKTDITAGFGYFSVILSHFCLLCCFPMSVTLTGVLFGPIDGAFGSILVPIGLVYVAQDVYHGVALFIIPAISFHV